MNAPKKRGRPLGSVKKKTNGKPTATKADKKHPEPSQPITTSTSPRTVATSAKLQIAMDALNEKHGKGSIIRANSSEHPHIDRIITGHFDIDEAFGGGIPRGRITELYGWESSGKTTLTQQVISYAQASGLTAALIDVEHAIDFEYGSKLGMDIDSLLFSQPNSAEEAMDILSVLVKSGEVGLVVIDSVAAMATRRELEGEAGDEHVAELPRLLSKELKKINPIIGSTNTAVIFVNQLREKIGMMGHGEQKVTPGGRALKFYASLRVELTKIAQISMTLNGDKITSGQKVKLKTVKNKVGPAMRQIEVELKFPTDLGNGRYQTPGFDGLSAMIAAAIEKGIMVGGGNKNYVFADGHAVKGAQNARDYLETQPELQKTLMAEIAA